MKMVARFAPQRRKTRANLKKNIAQIAQMRVFCAGNRTTDFRKKRANPAYARVLRRCAANRATSFLTKICCANTPVTLNEKGLRDLRRSAAKHAQMRV